MTIRLIKLCKFFFSRAKQKVTREKIMRFLVKETRDAEPGYTLIGSQSVIQHTQIGD